MYLTRLFTATVPTVQYHRYELASKISLSLSLSLSLSFSLSFSLSLSQLQGRVKAWYDYALTQELNLGKLILFEIC